MVNSCGSSIGFSPFAARATSSSPDVSRVRTFVVNCAAPQASLTAIRRVAPQPFYIQPQHFFSRSSRGSLRSSSPGKCRMSLSFGPSGNHSKSNFDDEEYMEAKVLNAVRMVPNRDHLMMTMENGVEIEVEHVHPSAGRLLYETSTPTIFLKMAENSGLILPIVVGELAINLLMKGVHRDKGARPHHYDLMQDLVHGMKYEIKMVKITQRVGDTYFARIYFGQVGEYEMVSVDARPSDAINLAVRSQVPIFVSKSIVRNDAVRIVSDVRGEAFDIHPTFAQPQNLDRPAKEVDEVTEEIALMKDMIIAAREERYADAAQIRDKIASLRNKNKRQLKNF